MRTAQRFWDTASIAQNEAGYAIHLDGRAVKTPRGGVLALPTPGLADAICAEWEAQEEAINPATMPMFCFAVTAIDRIAPGRDAVIDEISAYGRSDLVCYREAENAALAAHQQAIWQPYLNWFAENEGVHLAITRGIMPLQQDEAACVAMRDIVGRHDDLRLAGLHTLVTVSGSLVIGLAMAARYVSPEAGGQAALLDDLWQQGKWGYDAEADARIKMRMNLLAEASRFIAILGDT